MSLMRYYIGGGDARHSWPGSTLARISTQVTQVSNVCDHRLILTRHNDDLVSVEHLLLYEKCDVRELLVVHVTQI